MTPGPGIRPWPHWWEASALTTAPPLVPLNLFYTAGISLEQGENQQQTQPTYDAASRNRTQATMVGGERSHHCATPGPLESISYSGHIPRARREPTTNSTHI